MVSRIGRMLNKFSKRTFIFAAGCAASAVMMTGCRSMPGAGMFGMRGEPSAEMLAGQGPTVTYPAPPSAKATPEAIASVAGWYGDHDAQGQFDAELSGAGTTAQVAGFDVSPGYATQATNMAAAQANGIDSGNPTTKTGFDTPSTETTTPSSYAFGSKVIKPRTEEPTSAATSAASASARSGYALPGSDPIASPTAPLTTPSTTNPFTPPVGSTAASTSSSSKSGGFTLPSDSPSFSAITPPSSDPSAAAGGTTIDVGAESNTTASIMPPTSIASDAAGPTAAASPAFSAASVATGYNAPTTTSSVLPPSIGDDELKLQGYMPGSTGKSPGYPTGASEPTTQGSYYR